MTDMMSLCQAALTGRAADILLQVPGANAPSLDRRHGYLPLLVAYTHEDKEAKGLRKLAAPELPRPAVHFSALEMVATERALLLTGPHGGGKTSFALDLALNLLGDRAELPGFGVERLTRSLPRNDVGAVAVESWSGPVPLPLYLPLDSRQTLPQALDGHAPGWTSSAAESLLLIFDGAEQLGDIGPDFLCALSDLMVEHPSLRAVVLGESTTCRSWPLPPGFTNYAMLPLLAAQRTDHALRCAHVVGAPLPGASAAGTAPALPALFALALAIPDPPTDDDALLDAWLALAVPDPAARRLREAQGFEAWQLGSTSVVGRALAARHLARLDEATVVDLFRSDPALWAPVVTLAGPHLPDLHQTNRLASLALALARLDGKVAAWGSLVAARLLVADHEDTAREQLRPALVAALGNPDLPALFRDEAARQLSRLGDPRDLLLLLPVPGGRAVMGSARHPNSAPVHALDLHPFRIGHYPVTNASYAEFIAATGRAWRSPECHDPARRNVPATDLTWPDARAFCEWLTERWQAEGRIAQAERVRLPSEPEWEYAARGGQPDAGNVPIYPWHGPWRPDHANSAEAGFNDKTAVGLWPNGRSPFGVEDMTGQVWEWTSTLWGADMAVPGWRYPYDPEDGREAELAYQSLRRVLRGGCFSSDRSKACCTYRGSLEPDGFWRGNGFRIVVSS